MECNAITVNHHKMLSRIFATRLMLFCVGNAVDDDVTVNRIFLVNPVCSLQSAVSVCSLRSQSAVCGLQSAVCGLRSAVCSLQSAVCSLQSAVCKCHTPGFEPVFELEPSQDSSQDSSYDELSLLF